MSRSLPNLLLTGFDAFGSDPDNPSWDAVQRLDGETLQGHRIVARCLPVAFDDALFALNDALDETRPVIVVCVGLAGGRAQIALERVAINVIDARIPDNRGAQPVDVPVIDGGPPAYFATLPIKAAARALREHGIPAGISNTAGTYVCNQVFYGLMHALATYPGARGGFVHVPYSPEQAARYPDAPSLSPDTVADALRLILYVALNTREDERTAAGAEH